MMLMYAVLAAVLIFTWYCVRKTIHAVWDLLEDYARKTHTQPEQGTDRNG